MKTQLDTKPWISGAFVVDLASEADNLQTIERFEIALHCNNISDAEKIALGSRTVSIVDNFLNRLEESTL